jgi:hypothetical protein
MFLDVVLIILYPSVHFIAELSSHSHHPANPKEELVLVLQRSGGYLGWNEVPNGVVVGLGAMLVVKALATLTWGYAVILPLSHL